MIFTGFLPNATKKDLAIALSYFFLPTNWSKIKNGQYNEKVESYLKSYFNLPYTSTFDSGRSALYFALKALGVGEGDEVIVQAYTCIVVINAIKWTGAKPIFVEIGNDFNLDINDLNTKITQKTKAIIIQHTFGVPANLDAIINIARTKNIKTIEDCAHSLGIKYNEKLTGTMGDIGMFSFGTDKIVSCMRGGALITKDKNLGKIIEQYQSTLPDMKLINILQHLTSYSVFLIGKALYKIKIGKWLMGVTKALHITARIIDNSEKQGIRTKQYPAKLPNALANILFYQLQNLDKINLHRQKISQIYLTNIKNNLITLPKNNQTYLRFPILTSKPNKLTEYLKKFNIIAGDWYNTVIAPRDINWAYTEYQNKQCPVAEKLASQSSNLPTNYNITEKTALYICNVINNYVD